MVAKKISSSRRSPQSSHWEDCGDFPDLPSRKIGNIFWKGGESVENVFHVHRFQSPKVKTSETRKILEKIFAWNHKYIKCNLEIPRHLVMERPLRMLLQFLWEIP